MEGMWWRQVWSAARAFAAHTLLFTFTILLFLKLRHVFSCSWWLVFSPLWLFHAVVARGRFSVPSPSDRDDCFWAPFHAAVATPLLIAFELLLCVYLESTYVNKVAAVNLKIVFIPVLILETSIIIDNIRVTFWTSALEIKEKSSIQEITPDRRRGEDVQCEIMLNVLAITSMAFILSATVFMVQYLAGTGDDTNNEEKARATFMFFSVGLSFAYIICLCDLVAYSSPWKTRECRSLSSRLITSYSEPSAGQERYTGSSTQTRINARKHKMAKLLSLRSLGGHFTMVLIFGFRVLLYVYLKEGTPAGEIPLACIFSPLFLLQGIGVVFYTSQLVEGIVLMLHSGQVGNRGRYYTTFTTARAGDFLEFMCHGSRFLSWWSIDQGTTEMQARRLLHNDNLDSGGCNTFCGSHPDVVKKMPKKDLVEEVRTLQAAINEQINKSSQQDYQREKTLCKICFQREIDVLLLPCRHRILCRTCGQKCSKCPICRVSIAKRKRLCYNQACPSTCSNGLVAIHPGTGIRRNVPFHGLSQDKQD